MAEREVSFPPFIFSMVHSSNSESENSDDGNAAPPRRKNGLPEPALLINRQRAIEADWVEVRDFLRQLLARLARSSFSICLLSDLGIRRYNKQFRHKNEATDVLSFPCGERGDEQQSYLGDILISAETARANAERYGLRIEEEIKILALHGLLHLLGYDHENDGGRMARLERRWRRKLGLPQTLTERFREQLPDGTCFRGRYS